MKCKICGGALSFQNGNYLCESCGATFAIDGIYEKVDVYICYKECDGAGRRTRDSIIAQEVYRKLEDNKITTFYERVSADGMTGGDLESARLAAMCQSKVIVVLGTTIETFAEIEEKYGGHFNGKLVIPFCVDINPTAIPKSLSKIQAMSYATIGWDKDLIKGVYNILGREQIVDVGSLYGRRKNKTILISAIAAGMAIIVAIMAWLCLKLSKNSSSFSSSQLQTSTETTAKPLTQKEIYETAQDRLNNELYLEAADEFNKIIGYKDSTNQIKKIYNRYDGYYQDEDGIYSLYINVIDGKTIEFSFEKTVNYKTIKTEDFIVLENNCASGKYIDNLLNEGSISISLDDEYITLKISTEIVSKDLFFGEIENKFELKNKSDRPPIKAVTKEILLSWVSTLTYVEDIKTSGYELEYIPAEGEIDDRFGVQYKITNTDVIIVTTDNDLTKYEGEYSENLPKLSGSAVVAVIAPAELVCEGKIGKRAIPFENDGVIYCPNTRSCEGYQTNFCFATTISEFDIDSFNIKQDSLIGITSKQLVGEYNYTWFLKAENHFIDDLQRALIFDQFKKDHPAIGENLGTYILAENNNAILACVHLRKTGYGMNSSYIPGSYYYYKLNIKTEAVKFITEHSDEEKIAAGYGGILIREFNYEKWKRYPEIFGEFLSKTTSAQSAESTELPALNAQVLQDMVRGETTLGQLRRQGFELQFNENEKNTIATEYRLKNTDVIFAFSGMDPNTLDPLDDPVVVAISAPAYMIIPDKIGERNDAFEKDHIIYVPDGEIRGDVGTGVMFGFPEETADEYLAELGKIIKRGTIERNTNVCFTGTNPPASGYDWLYEIYIEGLPII